MVFKMFYLIELPALDRHLLHDVLGVEDGLEVEPALLAAEPGVQDVLHADQLVLPLLHLLLEGLDVGGAVHGLGLQDVVIQHHLQRGEFRESEKNPLFQQQSLKERICF